MTNLEIKQEIDKRNELIREILSPNVFTLNNTVLKLQKEIEEFQSKCSHNFVDGYCEYCYKEKETNEE